MRPRRLALATAFTVIAAPLAVVVTATPAHATGPDIEITEIAYGGLADTGSQHTTDGDGEYVELTNVGDTAQDLTGWTYETGSAQPTDAASARLSLTSLGTIAPGQSVIITDLTPVEFRTDWGLKSTVKVLQDIGHTLNSGPNGAWIFKGDGTTVADDITYAAKADLGGGKGVGKFVSSGQAATTTAASLTKTVLGDSEGSWTSASGSVGSPGASTLGTATPAAVTLVAGANVQVTEIAYGGLTDTGTQHTTDGDGEYVELTNVGNAAQDVTGWTYETGSAQPTDTASARLSLTSFGSIAPGESVVITDLTAAEFRTDWNLRSTVRVLQDTGHTLNSGPNGAWIFAADGTTVVDEMTYAAKADLGGGKGVGKFVSSGQTGVTIASALTKTTTADTEGSWTSASGSVGSPGASTLGITAPSDIRTAGVSISGGSNQTGTVGTAFSYAGLSASGGAGAPYTWTTTGLPADGLSINASTGAISGTPTSASTISVTVTATDGGSLSANASFTITIAPTVDVNWANIVINEVTSDNYDNTELTSHLAPALLTALGAGTDGASDLIELYNTGSAAVDVTGWKQMDSGGPASAKVFSSVLYDLAGDPITSIPAHGYAVFSSDSASTKGLSSGGDGVQIYLPNGTTLVDAISWGAAQAGDDESVSSETYHALARCGGYLQGTVTSGVITTTANDTTGAGTDWYSVKDASFGSSNSSACDTSTDADAAVRYYNEQPATGLPSGCLPSAPESSDGITVSGAKPWPTSDGVAPADNQCEFITAQDPTGNDISGLVFNSDGSVLWAAQNKNHLWKLVKSGGKYVPATDNSWGAGKGTTFTGTDPAASQPDTEGLTVGGNGNLFVTSERDNTSSNVSKDEVLEFDPTAAGTTLMPVHQWDLTPEFVPSIIAASGDDANLGFEGVTYVPDSFLTAHGFYDQHAQHTYNPSDYPNHIASGLFFLGLEKNGHVYGYELNSDGTTFQRVADIDTGVDGSSAIADLQFNADDQGIWTQCDNDCGVVASLLRINASGNFARVASFSRPTGLPDDNFEGFAIASASTATNGKREVLWSDDGIYGDGNGWNADHTGSAPSAGWGHALFSGTLPVESDYAAIGGTLASSAAVGTAYSSALTATGAFPDVPKWSLSSGSLPAGLSLNPATGAITGTPTTAGISTFTLAVTNGNGAPVTKQATITVTSGGPATAPSDPVTGGTATTPIPPKPNSPEQFISQPVAATNGGDSTKPVTIDDGRSGVHASASGGTGTLQVGSYNVNPIQELLIAQGSSGQAPTPTNPTGAYFDVRTSTGATFGTVQFSVQSSGGRSLQWWDTATSSWVPVAGASFQVEDGRITVTLDSTSSPSIGQLTGTIFAVSTDAAPTSGNTGSTPVAVKPVVKTTSKGAYDVFTISGLSKATGAKYTLATGSHRILKRGTVPASGKLVIRVKDAKPKAKAAYWFTVASTDATVRFTHQYSVK